MKTIFVTEASQKIGGGHVMRCLTLAGALRRRGMDVSFIVNDEASRFAPALARSDFPIETAASFEDAARAATRRESVDTIVCDSYAIAAPLERLFRPVARTIVIIDDLADRPHACDLLLDTTYGRDSADYRALVPDGTVVLAGARYALLRPEFAGLRDQSLTRRAASSEVRNILVSLGLTDVDGITGRVAAALLDLPLAARFDVVIGPNAQSRARIESYAARDSRLRLHVDPPDMVGLMARADLAIGAGGTTTWERCCLGLPTIMLVLADNQRLVAQALASAGAVRLIADAQAPDLADLAAGVDALAGDADVLRRMSSAASGIVDGLGADRVATEMIALCDADSYHLRPATFDDAERLFAWRNDEATRAASHNTEPVAWETHVAWLRGVLRNPDRRLIIAERSGEAVGVVRIDRSDDICELSWTIAGDQRGRGVGAAIVTLVAHDIPGAIRAEVKVGNDASALIAIKAGMHLTEERAGVMHFVRDARVASDHCSPCA